MSSLAGPVPIHWTVCVCVHENNKLQKYALDDYSTIISYTNLKKSQQFTVGRG